MSTNIPTRSLLPPPGRPNWKGDCSLPLIYLGWGHRDFLTHPLLFHYDLGSNFYILLSGEIEVETVNGLRAVSSPAIVIVPEGTAFGLRQKQTRAVEILVWVWRGRPAAELVRDRQTVRIIPVSAKAIDVFKQLHILCRREVVLADDQLASTLPSLRCLLEAEIARVVSSSGASKDLRWELVESWVANNLSIHNPVSSLCDYLGLAPSTLHRLFYRKTGQPPGAFFRKIKIQEAVRLIEREGWQVKATAYHLGYRHPNDLTRALKGKSR